MGGDEARRTEMSIKETGRTKERHMYHQYLVVQYPRVSTTHCPSIFFSLWVGGML